MVRLVILTLAASLTLLGCNGHKATSLVNKVAKQPQTHIHVNKEYDKSGDLVRYDSVYSSYFPNHEGDSNMQDSLLQRFKAHFNENYFFSEHPYFSNFFFEDSLLKYDFYKKDFFYNRYRNNISQMDKLFHEMDSVKNRFYSDQFRGQADTKR